jgi:hypothetical protein
MVVAAALFMMMALMCQPGETMRLRLPTCCCVFPEMHACRKTTNKTIGLPQQRHRTIKTCLNFCLAQKPAQMFPKLFCAALCC